MSRDNILPDDTNEIWENMDLEYQLNEHDRLTVIQIIEAGVYGEPFPYARDHLFDAVEESVRTAKRVDEAMRGKFLYRLRERKAPSPRPPTVH